MFRDLPSPSRTPTRPLFHVVVLLAVIAAELALLSLVFKHGIDFECRANAPGRFCDEASMMVVRAVCALGMVALLVLLKPASFGPLFSATRARALPVGLNLAGVVIALGPVALLHPGLSQGALVASAGLWAVGGTLATLGALLWLAPWPVWKTFLRTIGPVFPILLVAAWMLPGLARKTQSLWYTLHGLTEATFRAVAALLRALGYDVYTDLKTKVIGANDFYVDVGQPCSGIEGMALVTIFLTVYLSLFRHELRFPRVLILYPLGLLASATLNVVRITVLLVIGIEGEPELAVGGFHSHAGWLLFLTLSLALIVVVRAISWFHKPVAAQTAQAPALPPFFADPEVARILPFAVFMFTAVLASTFAQHPGLFYPARVIILGAVMALFWRFYRDLAWRIAAVPVALGGLVGIVWVVFAGTPEPDALPPYGTLAGGALMLWAVFRGFGTIVLVPLVEELFFRGYLERRLAFFKGSAGVACGIFLTSVAFAALHDKWLLAFGAALVFSYAWRRTGRITDAVIAHVVANAVVFGVAVVTGNYYLI